MALSLTCPQCRHRRSVPDQDAGLTVRCPKCGAEHPAVETPLPPAVRRRRALGRVLLGLLVLAAAGGGGWYAYRQLWSQPTDYADPDGVYTARFPNPPTAATPSAANPEMLVVGERPVRATVGGREYAVTVVDGLNPGDLEVGPAGRDTQAEAVLVLLETSANGERVHPRTVTHDGHTAHEAVMAGRGDSKLTAVRVVVGERCGVRMTATGYGNKAGAEAFLADAAGFFDTVRLGPGFGPPVLEDPVAVTAAELGAAYRADPKAADARFKDRWVRVTGPVKGVTADGRAFELDGGGVTIDVRRKPRARMEVPVRTGAAAVPATGKCLGLTEPADGAVPRVTLAEAVVPRLRPQADAK